MTVIDDQGFIIESTDGQNAFSYLHGRGNLLTPLEEALENQMAGFETSISIAAGKSFGRYHPELVIDVPREQFNVDVKIKKDQSVQAQGPNGMITFIIEQINDNYIRLNANHPLADKALTFMVKVLQVRDAHKDEVRHRRPHPGGHHLMITDSSWLGE